VVAFTWNGRSPSLECASLVGELTLELKKSEEILG
jgi:hypothetical protein